MDYFYMLKKLWKYSKGDHLRIVLYFILHGLSMIGMLGQPYAFSQIVNALQLNSDNLLTIILEWLTVYFCCFAIFEICHRSARWFERSVAFRSKKRFICSTYDHLQRLSLEWHVENHSGNIIDRVNRSANGLHSFSESQSMFISVAINFIGPMIILFQLSPVIVMVATLAGLLLVKITKIMYNRTIPEYRAYNEGFHHVAAGLYDYIGNITTIIVLRLGFAAGKDIENRIDNVFGHMAREHKFTQIKCFLNSLIVVMLNVGLIFYYIFAANKNSDIIMVGSVTILFSYLGTYMSTFDFYAGDYEQVIHWRADFEAVEHIFAETPTLSRDTAVDISDWSTLEVNIGAFCYNKGSFNLSDTQIKLKRNWKIAFVGESGTGKSTVLKLLRGIYAAEKGMIIKDGTEILSVSALADITTLIPQEPEIFENTIGYNITMGLSDDADAINRAVHLSGFDEVLERMPNGLETNIQEKGVNMSGGEKQRLALARGIFAMNTSSIGLFDEPTGSVDPATELKIYQNIFRDANDKCIISVLHRLHLARLFDYIYVFKRGMIVQEGTFDSLCRQEGEFKRLWDMYTSD